MSADPQTPLRADARRNRDQIIATARAIFAEQGPEVPMEEIARSAGVGVGTLYRRFPDREALIREVAIDNFTRVLTDARQALTEEPTAWQALVRLLHQSVELHLSVQLSLLSKKALEIVKDDPAITRLREELLVEVETMVRVAQEKGDLRPDVGAGDVALLFALLMRQMESRRPEIAAMSTARSIAIMIDGLRANPGTPLPGRPLGRRDIN